MSIHTDAKTILETALRACRPDEAVRRALEGRAFSKGRIVLVAAGKAAWQMAYCAAQVLGERLSEGVVVTKYGHGMGPIARCHIYEGGHPVPDENSFRGTEAAIALVKDLTEEDTVVFLLSGGGSALFESPLIPGAELAELTEAMLASGADIVEMNTVRKRLSAVKGGRFARLCAPAQVFAVVLSDILGDPLDMIASGPACPDASTCADAFAVAEKYRLPLSPQARQLLSVETPKQLDNGETVSTGRAPERALAAAPGPAGRAVTVSCAVGSDGTHGPTDAAGGMVDGMTMERLRRAGLSVHRVLADNDAYHALDAVGGLIRTGPTGTNVNDVAVVLLRRDRR